MTQEALKLALEALDNLLYWDNGKPEYDEAREAITAIKEALAQPEQDHIPDARKMVTEQEPVAYWKEHAQGLQRDYDSLLAEFQAQRTWVGLTDEEYTHITDTVFHTGQGLVAYYKAIEARLKEKNNA